MCLAAPQMYLQQHIQALRSIMQHTLSHSSCDLLVALIGQDVKSYKGCKLAIMRHLVVICAESNGASCMKAKCYGTSTHSCKPCCALKKSVKCKQCLATGSAPIFVFVDREVPKKMTDVPMMTTRFTCNARSGSQ